MKKPKLKPPIQTNAGVLHEKEQVPLMLRNRVYRDVILIIADEIWNRK